MGLNEKHGRHGTYHVITAMAGTQRVAIKARIIELKYGQMPGS